MIKAKLESEGIECRYLNENIVLAHNGLATAVGGVKLQVKQADFEQANAILDDYQQATTSDDDDDLLPIDYGEFEDIADRSVEDRENLFRWRAALVLVLMCASIYVAMFYPSLISDLQRLFGR